jgi:hypothetical protein
MDESGPLHASVSLYPGKELPLPMLRRLAGAENPADDRGEDKKDFFTAEMELRVIQLVTPDP